MISENKKTVVVIGHGMVGHRFCEKMVEFDSAKQFRIVTFCEESRAAYDRVGLTSFFAHRNAEKLMIARLDWQGLKVGGFEGWSFGNAFSLSHGIGFNHEAYALSSPFDLEMLSDEMGRAPIQSGLLQGKIVELKSKMVSCCPAHSAAKVTSSYSSSMAQRNSMLSKWIVSPGP